MITEFSELGPFCSGNDGGEVNWSLIRTCLSKMTKDLATFYPLENEQPESTPK